MSKVITIKLTKAGTKIGPFDIYDQFGNIIASNISKETLIRGISYSVDDNVSTITIKAIGDCKSETSRGLREITRQEYESVKVENHTISCIWTHLTDHTIFNDYYGLTEPYIIEYPFAYQYNDEILQNVEDYNKVYQYFKDSLHVSDRNNRIQIDDKWFNKAIVYNDQQSSGILDLNVKPKNNMSAYLKYPKFNADSKSILWAKVDNMYQYNTFWSLVKDKSHPLFLTTCESLSIDKVVNQSNMDYSMRAFRKDTIRAKDVKIRHYLENKNNICIVTQFIIAPAMLSYK